MSFLFRNSQYCSQIPVFRYYPWNIQSWFCFWSLPWREKARYQILFI